MPTKRTFRTREKKPEFGGAAERTLCDGLDFFRDFPGEAGQEELLRLWRKYGDELLAAHKADGTRCAGWWWFSAPENLRSKYPHVPLPTKQRGMLLAANLLDAAEAQTARRRIREFGESGRSMAYFDLCP